MFHLLSRGRLVIHRGIIKIPHLERLELPINPFSKRPATLTGASSPPVQRRISVESGWNDESRGSAKSCMCGPRPITVDTPQGSNQEREDNHVKRSERWMPNYANSRHSMSGKQGHKRSRASLVGHHSFCAFQGPQRLPPAEESAHRTALPWRFTAKDDPLWNSGGISWFPILETENGAPDLLVGGLSIESDVIRFIQQCTPTESRTSKFKHTAEDTTIHNMTLYRITKSSLKKIFVCL